MTEHINRLTLLMRNEVRLEHIQAEHDARLRALAHFERAERSYQRQEYNSIKADISPRTYENELNRLQGHVCGGTGKWLMRDATFSKWLDISETSTKVLWLQGIPGAGVSRYALLNFSSRKLITLLLQGRRTSAALLSQKLRRSDELPLLSSLTLSTAVPRHCLFSTR